MDIEKAYQEIAAALSEVMTISPAGDGFTLVVKRAFHDGDGKPISGLFFMLNDLTICSAAGKPQITLTDEGTFSAAQLQGKPISSTDGGFITLDNFINLAMVDPETVPYIDMERAKRAAEEISAFYERQIEQISATPENVITIPSPRQAIISDKDYSYALTTRKNKYAYIALVEDAFFKEFSFENGKIMYDQEVLSVFKQSQKGSYTDIKDLDTPLLVQIFTTALTNATAIGDKTITVKMTPFFRKLGEDLKCGSPNDVLKKIHIFQNTVGVMPKMGTMSDVLHIIQIDRYNDTITLAVPYMMELIEILKAKNTKTKKLRSGEEIKYLNPHYNILVHSNIVAERNKPAVELVYAITNGLLQRGGTPDAGLHKKKKTVCKNEKAVTYSVTFRALLEASPLLTGRLNDYKTTADRNKALKRAFDGAYKLIEKRTDASKYFTALQMPSIIPTWSTLDDKLTITHQGINGDYRPSLSGEVS